MAEIISAMSLIRLDGQGESQRGEHYDWSNWVLPVDIYKMVDRWIEDLTAFLGSNWAHDEPGIWSMHSRHMRPKPGQL